MKDYQLPKEFATKWVAALRSGKYEQDTDSAQYFNPDTKCYCVMGVAAVVNDYEIDSHGENATKNGVHLDKIFGNKLFRKLYGMNDYDGKTFPEIADWLEENCEFV